MASKEATKLSRHQQRMSWLVDEACRQADTRRIMRVCEDFYDGAQWDADEARELERRGQRATVYNEVAPTIDVLIGTERRARIDFTVTSEDDDDAGEQDARVKTKLLKYLEAENNTAFERSLAAKDAFRAGVGWLYVGLRGDKSGPSVVTERVSWRCVLHDSRAERHDLQDARYAFILKVVDLDVAIAAYPEKEELLRSVSRDGDDAKRLTLFDNIMSIDEFEGPDASQEWSAFSRRDMSEYFNPRPRVLLIEAWWREPITNSRRKGSGLSDALTMQVRCAVMTETETLEEMASPFEHDRFPLVPIWAYRSASTGMPYSPILRLLGPQIALNSRMSKALWEAAANQVEIEEDAINPSVMDVGELRDELNSPDGMAIYARGALSGGKVRTRQNEGRARDQLALAERDIMHLQRTSGVNEESRGLRSGATSKVAMDAKFERGSIAMTELLDNLAAARKAEGEMTLSLAEQFMLHPMTLRIGDDSGKFSRIKINQIGPDGEVLNDIGARRAHFTVGESPWRQAYGEAAFASVMDVLTQLSATAPAIVVNLLDIVFEMHPNLPRKSQILERIRQVNGQREPGAKPTPEQQAQAEQQAQVQQAKFQAEMAQLMASVKEAQAKGEKLDAESVRIRLTAVYEAAQAAQVLAQAPGVAPVADELLRSAGFADAGVQSAPAAGGLQGLGGAPSSAAGTLPDLQQADGLAAGIETPAPDGVR